MSMLGGRGGRSDDWSSQHARARARASERLDGPIEAEEAQWLEGHLAACSDCAAAATDYALQRLELRTLRDRVPEPPRDLWARTAAAIERESRHRSLTPPRPHRRSILAPYALLAGALVVAVVVGTLSSSQHPVPTTTTPSATGEDSAVTVVPSAGATPLAVARQVDYLGRGGDGVYRIYTTKVSEVCPRDAGTCAATQPSSIQDIGPLASPESVFGSGDAPLVVLGNGANGSSVYAVDLPAPSSDPSETPSPSIAVATPRPTATASAQGTADPSPTAVAPTASASPGDTSATPSGAPSDSPSPTSELPASTPTPAGTVEIARGVEVVDTTAAYAPNGTAFAFTARPADGSHGPDIYLWTVGDAEAKPITTDHRSVFGSWAGSAIVGSTVVTSEDGATNEPSAFIVRTQGDASVPLPETGLAWRPAVDPTEGSAVYWAGTLEPTDDDLGWRTVAGRLVLGRWNVDAGESNAPSATPLNRSQATERGETTIAEGPLVDWDVRWDETGTRLAVWIANGDDPTVGALSLYVVDPATGAIDLEDAPLIDEPALAGFSIADGRLAWAAPTAGTDDESKVLILAWTNDGFGQVESAPGDFLLVR